MVICPFAPYGLAHGPKTWIFKVKFWKCCISGMGGPIDMEQKGCESIGCYTHFVTSNFDLNSLIFKIKFWKSCIRNGMADSHGTKGMWVDRMLDPCCDLQHSPHPWPWPWIFKVKVWKCYISGMAGPIDMERKGCESIGCYIHFVTFNFDLNHDLDLGFSKIVFPLLK